MGWCSWACGLDQGLGGVGWKRTGSLWCGLERLGSRAEAVGWVAGLEDGLLAKPVYHSWA
ncbi:UNVERIFIED_CONTAM: hypothetical protein Sangu_1583900 [Sesamum angustifolium]|uniref:Uncharacterized protein n=1 Tax=Sesamum angustifolium TaxID=2727405 RepID=A0AAW2MRL8_9LAMI